VSKKNKQLKQTIMKSNDITITLIKQSERGAWLITDGVKQAWTRPSSRRLDGTWTDGAYKALQESTQRYITPEEQEKQKEEYIQRKQVEREERQKPVFLIVNCEFVESEKCYKVTTGRKMKSPYKKNTMISEYVFIPKSQVKVNGNVFEMPTWLYEANYNTYCLIGILRDE
jgi:hypothetical protein